jgi:hypothetical protein
MRTCRHDYNEDTCPTCYAHDAFDAMGLTYDEWIAKQAGLDPPLSDEGHVVAELPGLRPSISA